MQHNTHRPVIVIISDDSSWLSALTAAEAAGATNATQIQNAKLKGSVKEPNKFHIYETAKITCKASDAAEYIELFGSFTQDPHARRI